MGGCGCGCGCGGEGEEGDEEEGGVEEHCWWWLEGSLGRIAREVVFRLCCFVCMVDRFCSALLLRVSIDGTSSHFRPCRLLMYKVLYLIYILAIFYD